MDWFEEGKGYITMVNVMKWSMLQEEMKTTKCD